MYFRVIYNDVRINRIFRCLLSVPPHALRTAAILETFLTLSFDVALSGPPSQQPASLFRSRLSPVVPPEPEERDPPVAQPYIMITTATHF